MKKSQRQKIFQIGEGGSTFPMEEVVMHMKHVALRVKATLWLHCASRQRACP